VDAGTAPGPKQIARGMYDCGRREISTRDAVHTAAMLNQDLERIATCDGGFDRVAGIRRARFPTA